MVFVKGHRAWATGRKFTQEHRNKLSQVRRLKIKLGLIKHPKGMLGKRQSSETRKKISQNHKFKVKSNRDHQSKLMKGENHWNWKGGISPRSCNTREYKEWRSAVFKRDNWTCQTCQRRGCYLEAHHIKRWVDYPALRFRVDNGVTLCKECHLLTLKMK